MEVVPYRPDMVADVAAAYNRAVCGVPHCYPVDAGEFAEVVAERSGHAESEKPWHSQAAFVALDGASVLGFADAAVGYPREGEEYVERGVIRMFWYEPGRRDAGQALLEAAETALRGRGQARVQAFPHEYRYRFYHLESAYLSDHLGHVGALLGFHGYRRSRGEVYMDWPNFEPLEPTLPGVPVDVSVERRPGAGKRPGVKVTARLDGKEIGECTCDSCGEYTRAEEAQDWFFTSWIGVEREHEGKGLGKHLLRRALKEMRAIGYRHAAISTERGNYRAFLFYANFGYRVVDWTYGYGREPGSPT